MSEEEKTEKERKEAGRYSLKRRFTAKRLAFVSLFVALSYVVSLFDFPVFPAVPFLKLDFGNVFILLVSLLCGPIEGVLVCVLKEGLRALGSSSGGVGEIANILVTVSYIALPSVFYRYKKGFKGVMLCLIGACFIGTGVALLANRFITFPLYMGEKAGAVFRESFLFIVIFNLVKTVSVGILTVLLYKRLSDVLKKLKI